MMTKKQTHSYADAVKDEPMKYLDRTVAVIVDHCRHGRDQFLIEYGQARGMAHALRDTGVITYVQWREFADRLEVVYVECMARFAA